MSREGQGRTCAAEGIARAARIALDGADVALVPREALLQQRPHLLQRVRDGLWIPHIPETGSVASGMVFPGPLTGSSHQHLGRWEFRGLCKQSCPKVQTKLVSVVTFPALI